MLLIKFLNSLFKWINCVNVLNILRYMNIIIMFQIIFKLLSSEFTVVIFSYLLRTNFFFFIFPQNFSRRKKLSLDRLLLAIAAIPKQSRYIILRNIMRAKSYERNDKLPNILLFRD